MPTLSATVITLNEAANIGRALESLACADEIVVVDAGSKDGTREIARRLGARVVERSWQGFSAQKNFASSQAKNDWVLSLDADEVLSPEAQNAIRQWKILEPAAAGYRLARRARYLGRWILHGGWYPDYKIRLFDRRRSHWRGDFVHESVEVSGNVGTLPGEILHYTCDSLEEHKQRIEFYTDLAAREMISRHDRAGFARRALAPPWVFFNTFFLRMGVLDGRQGFLIAWMAARYLRRKYRKWLELRGELPQGLSGGSREVTSLDKE